ncbi:hypothetical protein QOT17_006590 [Balamuthia mandrillaris]
MTACGRTARFSCFLALVKQKKQKQRRSPQHPVAFSQAHREGRKGSCPKLILSTQEQCKRTGFSRAFSTNPFAASSVVHGKFTPPSDIPEIETSTKERRVQAELQENSVMFTQWQNKRVRLEFEVHENWEVGLFHDPKSFQRFFSTEYFSYGLSPIASTYMCTTFSMGDNQLTHSSIPPTLIRNFTSPPSSADALRKYFVSNPCDSKSLARERREFGCLLEVKQTALEWSRPQRWADAVTLVVEVDGRAKHVKFTVNGAESEPLPTPFEPFVLALTTGNSDAKIALVQQSVTLCL